jgi:hypothetical protein
MKHLPSTCAFVVQFRDADQGCGILPGRIEHVASGNTATFQRLEDLPQILLALLRRVKSDEEDRNRGTR